MIPLMNGLTSYALGTELGRVLRGARIKSVLRFRSGITLAMDNSNIPFLHILFTTREAELLPMDKLIVPSRHTVEILSFLKDAAVTDVTSPGLDRIILIHLESKDQWGGNTSFSIRIDLTPGTRAFSLFQLPGNKLHASIGVSSCRKPASPSELPPAKRWSLLSLPVECPDVLVAAANNLPETHRVDSAGKNQKGLSGILVSTVSGIDPLLAKTLVKLFGPSPEPVWQQVREIGNKLLSKSFAWNIYDIPGSGKASYCSIYPFLLPIPPRPEKPGSLIEAFNILGSEKIIPDYRANLKRKALSIIKKDINKSRKLIDNLSEDLAQADRTDEMRHYGNLLVTFRHLIQPGMKEIELRDFSGENTVIIPLDPAISPDRNIRLYFRKAKKGEKGRLVIRNHRIEAKREFERKNLVYEKLSSTTSIKAILGFLPREASPGGLKKDLSPQKRFRRFRLDDNHTVLVGRSDAENDFLTHHFASPTDLWFHAQGCAGSHVILRGSGRSTPKRFIEKAAEIAAWFSKARKSGTVPVVYTEKRYVKKPRKSRPGTAVCLREKTIFVTPSVPDDPGVKNFR